ncbi:unnamed protein product [Tenebrio molitor]|nr:unnamed protein product [Tenebrio molitor]
MQKCNCNQMTFTGNARRLTHILRLLLDVCLMVGVVGKTFPKGANVLQEFRAFLN